MSDPTAASAPTLRYQEASVAITATHLAHWEVQLDSAGQPSYMRGPCPRCKDVFNAPVGAVVPVAAAVETVREIVEWPLEHQRTRRVTCLCEKAHRGRPKNVMSGCGASWSVTLREVDDGAWRVEPADPRMITAAGALAAQIAATDLKTIRGTAEKWLGGLTALYGLFSLSGAIVAKDSVAKLSDTAKISVAILGAGGLVSAVIAIVCGYVAAHGWPKVENVANDAQLKAWVERRPFELQNRVPGAIKKLHLAVICSIVTLALLSGALGVLWIGPANDPAVGRLVR